jgi:hypothetical protein
LEKKPIGQTPHRQSYSSSSSISLMFFDDEDDDEDDSSDRADAPPQTFFSGI